MTWKIRKNNKNYFLSIDFMQNIKILIISEKVTYWDIPTRVAYFV